MHIDPEDRPLSVKRKTTRSPNLLIAGITAISLAGFAYLQAQGFGITIDLKKLSEAFVLNGTGNSSAAAPPSQTSDPAPQPPATPSREPENHRPSEVIYQPSLRPPINWEVQVAVFNSIYIKHPACNPQKMAWTQMQCSNFRARAMKRFQKEWRENSYWDGKKIITNKSADNRVNAELTW
jgi:hypothetical protein